MLRLEEFSDSILAGCLSATPSEKKGGGNPRRQSIPPQFHSQRFLRNHCAAVPLETELYSGLIPEVALVVVALGKVIPEASQQVLELRWPDGDVLVYGNVDAAADEKIKRIVAWGLAGDETPSSITGTVKIAVKIAVSAAEQRLNKWLEMRKAEFYDRTNVVGEQIALSRHGARTVAVRGRDSEVVGIAAIALEFALDSDHLGEVIRQ